MKRLFLAVAALIFAATASYAQPAPTSLCFTTNGANCVPGIQASNSAPITAVTATTTQIVALIAGKKIYVTSFDLVSTAANTVQFVYGTGTNCGTGTTALTGVYGMSTFTVITKGDGVGTILFVPAGNAFCVVTGQAVQLSGSVSFAQF